eukprot:CAMPEP_0197641262 /NCGR_PEP_ID=MMETSP1338-20131121/15277_1 /TAXON_ID=43686 ORGANISM="Pelagodinium beii, Strain RCC1491" /NCGR_SAMPLE_ID=MMETSP1338 /ASSEMBLY_ACC=CAM_ASM_000754 /LENGTH=122 /DNA_ID=CAMNT_0043214213 /DNA_START=277 /DNA_END=643 /DNA_ORIENTATION=+
MSAVAARAGGYDYALLVSKPGDHVRVPGLAYFTGEEDLELPWCDPSKGHRTSGRGLPETCAWPFAAPNSLGSPASSGAAAKTEKTLALFFSKATTPNTVRAAANEALLARLGMVQISTRARL